MTKDTSVVGVRGRKKKCQQMQTARQGATETDKRVKGLRVRWGGGIGGQEEEEGKKNERSGVCCSQRRRYVRYKSATVRPSFLSDPPAPSNTSPPPRSKLPLTPSRHLPSQLQLSRQQSAIFFISSRFNSVCPVTQLQLRLEEVHKALKSFNCRCTHENVLF